MIAIGSDHAGYALKEVIKKYFDNAGIEYTDYGTYDENSCDYPVYADKVCEAVTGGKADKGILVCGTGLGMCIAANKHAGIRSATVSHEFSAEMSRRHNDINVLCLGGRMLGSELALRIVDIYLNTEFEGGKHQRRVSMFKN